MPHGDGFTLHFPDQGAKQDLMLRLRQHAYAMRNLSVPARWPAPAAPLITNVTRLAAGAAVELAWRGAALAVNYTVARSSTGPAGPWTVVCQQCATDYDTPWQDRQQPPSSGKLYYRVQGFNLDGLAGPWSPVYSLSH